MNSDLDVIVIGVGSMGSSACYHLAQRGCKVLGIEQFGISHEFGSHAGQSRIIRKAYFEDSNYVPLLHRAYENWKLLENETGTQVYFPTGLAYFGPPRHPLMQGVKQSAGLYDIQLVKVTIEDAMHRFPQFRLPQDFEILFEPDAGFLTPERAIQLYAKEAMKKGAAITVKEKVTAWKVNEDGVTVTTDKGSYHARKLVITAGAWIAKLVPQLSRSIRITRQVVAWLNPAQWKKFSPESFPCWLLADPNKPGCYYGFPSLPEDKFGPPAGIKIAHHAAATETDPDTVNRELTEQDEEDLKYAYHQYFREKFVLLSYKICLYANSPDENFIIDYLPGYSGKVLIAAGFSGHGFKFASAIGEILADLAISGTTQFPIDFLSAARILH